MNIRLLKENIVFNVFKTLLTILYPILTFTYVSRVISVEGLGGVSFSKNFVSYFCLFASLGVNYYGTREGAKIVNDKSKFSKLFWEVLIINIISTTFSFIAFLFMVFCIDSLENYRLLLLVNAVSIVLSGLNNEWVLSAVEKYKLIAIRTMMMQLICIMCMFLFIHNESDYIVYAILLIVSGYGFYVFNWIYIIRSHVVERVPFRNIEIKKHFKPIFVLFAMLISIDLYTLLDTTMLGLVQGDRAVGIYSAAIKVPRLVNSMIASVGTVLVPKLSYFYENDRDKFDDLIYRAMTFVFLISIPAAIGVFGMSEEIIMIICGRKYVDSILTLRILSIIIMIIPISVLFNNQIFIPMRKEIYVLKSTCAGAVVNIIANSILIPKYAENGAAAGTILAELTVMIICIYHVYKELNIRTMGMEYLKRIAGGTTIIPVIFFSKFIIPHTLLRMIFAVVFSGLVFGVFSFPTIKKLVSR